MRDQFVNIQAKVQSQSGSVTLRLLAGWTGSQDKPETTVHPLSVE